MEWVEITGRTVEEAKDAALDQLGVDTVDAEFEILEEPSRGLFGKTTGQARVRARIAPTQPRPKVERRDRRKKSSGTGGSRNKAQRPDEPVTTGIDMGPGAGSNVLGMKSSPIKLSDSLASMLPYDPTGEIAVLYQAALSQGN